VQRLFRKVLACQRWLLLGLGVAGGVFYYRMPIEDPAQLRSLVADAQDRKDWLVAQRDKLLQRIDWLKTEPEYLQIAAQDKLLRTKEGEKVVRFK
jgi:cell division protein FtsB